MTSFKIKMIISQNEIINFKNLDYTISTDRQYR